MELQLNSPKIWLACEPVDFRKSIDGLSEVLAAQFNKSLGPDIVVFYNRARDKLKLLARHRFGCVLIYKRLDNKKFTFARNHQGLYELSAEQLSWLLSGLDWQAMSHCHELEFDDYF